MPVPWIKTATKGAESHQLMGATANTAGNSNDLEPDLDRLMM